MTAEDRRSIEIARYPMPRLLCWSRHEACLSGREALAIYEREWRLVEPESLGEEERAPIDSLAQDYGGGVLKV